MDRWKVTAIFLAVVLAVGAFVFFGPLPILDRGHKTSGVCSLPAMRAVVEVVEATTEERLDYVFKYGPTTQALFKDGVTVVNLLANSPCRSELGQPTGDSASFTVSDPQKEAMTCAAMFHQKNFKAVAEQVSSKLWLCRTTALNSADIVYRRHAFMMGERPKEVPLY
jgi:hypothetical protein